MTSDERERLVRRILSGKLYCNSQYNGDNIAVIFFDPSLDILVESDYIYKNFYDKNKDSAMTVEDSYKILKDNGTWTSAMQIEMETLNKSIKQLKLELNNNQFIKNRHESIKANIKKYTKRIEELNQVLNSMLPQTIEYLANRVRQRWIISKITKITGINNFEPKEITSNLYDILTVLYYSENAVTEPQFRELARKDPWRLYYSSSKTGSTPLFRHSLSEMTEYQHLLMLWSRIYDFAFESTNRPNNNIIEDDSLFDEWYSKEIQRLDKESGKKEIDIDPNIARHKEIFLPADAMGAAEVYDLNTPEARSVISSREKAIDKADGNLNEVHLPDVKRKFQQEVNQLIMNRGT